MAAKSPEKTPAVDQTSPDAVETPAAPTPTRAPGECVVDEAFHVGRAVNGKVCSYHAMRYRADGTPR